MAVKKGDIVLYSKYAGTEVNVDGNDYLILRESDVLGHCGLTVDRNEASK